MAKELLSPPPFAENLSIDEVSYRKYHRYLTNVVDVDSKKVIWNEKGRKKEILNKYYIKIGTENCKRIKSVAMDGAKTYISSTKEYAVNACIVLDRFHIVKKVNDALDRVRKDELNKAREEKNTELIGRIGCKQRFILLKKRNNLTKYQTVALDQLCQINEPIYKALLLKESFLEIYSCGNEAEAKEHLIAWLQEAIDSGIAAFKSLAESLSMKAQYILNWFKMRISSAISEGINNKIKRLKRMAYGYRDIEYFKLKIHQHCGLLNPRLEP